MNEEAKNYSLDIVREVEVIRDMAKIVLFAHIL